MIARTEIDKCFSTALNGHGAFNFDASLYSGFMAADKISLNRPCGNGMPSAGAICKQGIIGLRT